MYRFRRGYLLSNKRAVIPPLTQNGGNLNINAEDNFAMAA